MHVLTPNIYRTLGEAKQTFNYITDKGNFGYFDRELARWSGVAIMVRAVLPSRGVASWLTHCLSLQYTLSHTRLKKKHGITDERKALYEEVNLPVSCSLAVTALTRNACVGGRVR